MSASVLVNSTGDFIVDIDGEIYFIQKSLKAGNVRSFLSKFPKEYKALLNKGQTPRVFGSATKANINFIHKSMTEGSEGEPDTSLPTGGNSIPVSNELENAKADKEREEYDKAFDKTADNNKKEFVIDVKGLDIKREITNAVVSFVGLKAEAGLEKQLDRLIAEAVKKLTPNYIKIGERKQIKIEGRTHRAFEEAIFLCQHHRQMFISGPAGTGKTTLGEQIAKAFGLEFAFISCSAGMSEAHLLGRMLFDGVYVPSDFVTVYENGGVFLMDEVDAADANTLLTINSALANGIVAIPNRKEQPHAKRHKDCIIICSANTWGNGSFEYHGRNHLDAAFMDRFAMSRLAVDYDVRLEKEFCSNCPELAKVLWNVRKECYKNKIRKIISTRAFKEGAIAMSAGMSLEKVMKRFFTGWTDEEIAKVYDASKLGSLEEPKEELETA